MEDREFSGSRAVRPRAVAPRGSGWSYVVTDHVGLMAAWCSPRCSKRGSPRSKRAAARRRTAWRTRVLGSLPEAAHPTYDPARDAERADRIAPPQFFTKRNLLSARPRVGLTS